MHPLELGDAVEEKMSDSAIALDTYFGIKAGMTRVFDEQGNHVPVTVIQLIPNLITQVKTKEKEGYKKKAVVETVPDSGNS
jgi:large subunit ribosomal protein L3